MRYSLFFFLFFFCINTAIAQSKRDNADLNEIENAISSGKLNHAKILTKKLSQANFPNAKQRSYLYFAKIALYQGDLKSMNSFLPRIKAESPDINYFKNILYGHYLLGNNNAELGYQSLKNAMDIRVRKENNRIRYSKMFTQLQLILYEKSYESADENGTDSGKLIDEYIAQLEKEEGKMELFEKFQLYQYQSQFCSISDTLKYLGYGQKLLHFGQENDFGSAKIIGNRILANFTNNDSLKLDFLNAALKETDETNIIFLNSLVYFDFVNYYKEKGDLDEAIFWAKKAIYPDFLDQNENLNPYDQLSELYELKGDLVNALYYKKIGEEKSRVDSQKNAVNIREYLIDGLEKNINEKNELLNRNQLLIIGISIFSGILLVLLYFILRMGRRLKKALDSVQKANSEMEVFSRILSHDLKAPIFTISKLVGYVLEDEKELNFQSKSYLIAAKDTCEQSDVLINNIMIFLRSKDKSVPFADVSFRAIMNVVETNLQEQIKMNEVKIIENNFPEFIHVNSMLFAQLLQNLIQNSIKYRRLEEDPIIEITCEKSQTGFNLAVRDNGKGISPEKTETIVKAFEQDLSNSINEGIGLGLAISASIVKLHNGNLTITNNDQFGITVNMKFRNFSK